jgi:hypothetical protein
MAKLTLKQRGALNSILMDASRANAYIMSPETAVCYRKDRSTTTLDYTRPDGAVLTEAQREYGSLLCRLPEAIRKLQAFLDEDAAR